MAGGLTARSLVMAASLAVVLPVAAAAAEAPTQLRVRSVQYLPGDPRECAEVAARYTRYPRAYRPCLITIVTRSDAAGGPSLLPRAAAAAANQYWEIEVFSLAWRAKMSYSVGYDWGRRVWLNWRRCSVPYSIGYSISFTWCSAWPDWSEPDWIDVGMDWTVSFLWHGFPIRADYWARRTHNYKGGFDFLRYGRG